MKLSKHAFYLVIILLPEVLLDVVRHSFSFQAYLSSD
jgi:hypothetical protein